MTRIYMNVLVSEYFNLPYSNNDGVKATVHSDALLQQGGYDKEHTNFFMATNGDLNLTGCGLGWWLVNA